MRVMPEIAGYHLSMTHLKSSADSRTLTVVLSESDWRALRAVEPDAVGWLHAQIRERLGTTPQEPKGASRPSGSNVASWGDDLY